MNVLTRLAYEVILKGMVGPEGFHFHFGSPDFAHAPGERKMSEFDNAGSWFAAHRDKHQEHAAHHDKHARDLGAAAGLFKEGEHGDISRIIRAKANAHSNLANLHMAGHTRSHDRQGWWNHLNSPGSDFWMHGLSPKGEISRDRPATTQPALPQRTLKNAWTGG